MPRSFLDEVRDAAVSQRRAGLFPKGTPQIGDPTKAREQLGWTPKVGFEELVRMMVDSDLAQEKERTSR